MMYETVGTYLKGAQGPRIRYTGNWRQPTAVGVYKIYSTLGSLTRSRAILIKVARKIGVHFIEIGT